VIEDSTPSSRDMDFPEGTHSGLGILFSLLAGTYVATAVHEIGHYNQAAQYGYEPGIRLGLVRSGESGGPSLYLGKTIYGHTVTDPVIRRSLALSGFESTRNVYERLNEVIKSGSSPNRFSSVVALMLKTDFFRSGLLNNLRDGQSGLDDIEEYSRSAGAQKSFIYAAATCDLLFDWKDINYHFKRILGENPPTPQTQTILGFHTRPRVFVSESTDIAIGFTCLKKW
jgi:hypothetical protein